MGMKLRDFVKSDSLKLTDDRIDELLISILGMPENLCIEIGFLRSRKDEYNYGKDSLLPMKASREYVKNDVKKVSVFLNDENNMGANAA